VAASLALILTEVLEYLPPAHAAVSQTVLVLIAAFAAFALIAVALRVSAAVVDGRGEAARRKAPTTRGILVSGRVRQVDRLENMLSLGQQEAILESTLSAAELSPGESLVDVGCGTGKLFFAAARMLGGAPGAKNRLLGIDATPGMIDLALERAREAGVKVEFQVGVAETLPVPDGSADAVTSSYFFHHLPSEVKPVALREMWRVLAPGGRLVITDYGRARGLYGLIASIPMRANFYEYVRPQLGGELERIIAAEGLGEAETVALYLGYITVMRLRKPA
jgi:ubiquinone/menaquinone biosynthesis C-methylase UbiE